MISFESVDFPEPFGPISAWIWPCSTVRSIPRRISRPSIAACRSRTSRVAGAVVAFVPLISSHLDQDIVVGYGHGEHVDRLDRRQHDRTPGREVERRSVLRALDRPLVHIDLPLVQVVVLV